MKNLPFKKVAQIEQICSNIPLDGLVLILTGKERNGGVLVYLNPKSSIPLSDGWQIKGLSELQDEDFLTWNGLTVGYDPLSLKFPLLLTQGPNFYSIRYLFTALKNGLDSYQENAQELALWLYQNNSEASLTEHFSAKLIELLAPNWLEAKRSAGSVGLASDSSDLSSFYNGQNQPKWVTLADLENDPASAAFLLTFNEIKQVIPDLMQCPHFIEWRPILWKNERQDVLMDALNETAQFTIEQAKKRNQPQLHHLAYAFALEKWLTQTDTEHLVAVFPHGEFENFLKTGKAVFVKQMPGIYVGVEDQHEFFTLIDLIKRDKGLQNALGKGYNGTPFCIQPLSKSTQVLTPVSPWSLEKILYAVGKGHTLSATFLNLANDFLRYEDLKSAQFSAEHISNIALQGTYLLALGDPWKIAWRGRFYILLDQAYAILNDALLHDEKARQSQESRSLRAWYGLYQERNLPRRWNELGQLAQDTVGTLSAQKTYLSDVLAGRKIPEGEARQIRDLQNPLVSWEEIIPVLTKDFLGFYQEWYLAHQNRIEIEQNLLHAPPSAEEIEQVLNIYRNIQRRLYALPHEVIVLQHLCAQDVNALERLKNALQKKIALQVHLLTNKIFLGEATRLLFEVQNIGGQDARNIELFLEESPQYEILEKQTVQYPFNLTAHTGGYRLEWHIRAQEGGVLRLRLKSHLSKNKENEDEQFEFSLSVIRRKEKPQGPHGGNPFQAGVAVEGDKFFGRKKELKSIFDFLLYKTTQPVLLRGPRRMGKTSILHQIGYLLAHPGELQRQLGYDREDEVQLQLIRPIFTTLQGIKSEKEIPGWYFDLFTKILEKTGFSLDAQITFLDYENDPQRVFERHIKQFLDHHPEIRLVILMDEWDEQRHLAELGGKLRALMQNEKRLNWVISSTWMLSAEHGSFGSPFYGQTRAFELKEMSWEEAKYMVEILSERVGITWQSEALVTFLDHTALRPYLLQTLGQRIYEYLDSAKQPFNVVELDTIRAVISNFVSGTRTQGSHFAFLWEDETPKLDSGEPQARLSWLGRLILLTLEQSSSGPLKLIEIRNFLRTKFQEMDSRLLMSDSFDDNLVENLYQLELIFDAVKKVGDRYTFSTPLEQDWFHYAIRQYDPWQFAFERLKKEAKKSGRTLKEQK